jgi:hypothetical protein
MGDMGGEIVIGEVEVERREERGVEEDEDTVDETTGAAPTVRTVGESALGALEMGDESRMGSVSMRERIVLPASACLCITITDNVSIASSSSPSRSDLIVRNRRRSKRLRCRSCTSEAVSEAG